MIIISDKYRDAIKRMGKFGELFIDYKGCPNGPSGRMCAPIEEEVLGMPVIEDVDGERWRPVNEDALQELLKSYVRFKSKLDVIHCGQCGYCMHQEGLKEVEWICVEPHNYCDCGAKIVTPDNFCGYAKPKKEMRTEG